MRMAALGPNRSIPCTRISGKIWSGQSFRRKLYFYRGGIFFRAASASVGQARGLTSPGQRAKGAEYDAEPHIVAEDARRADRLDRLLI